MDHDTQGDLVRELRRALNHLYDPAELRASPLLMRLQLDTRGDPASGLRRVLGEAIASLKPDKATPLGSAAWYLYRLLSQRFLEQSPQSQVARDLGLGIRQYRRHEAQAIGVLVDHLRGQYDLAPVVDSRITTGAQQNGTPSRQDELAWLHETAPMEPVDMPGALLAAARMLGPMAELQRVHLEIEVAERTPMTVGQATALRQAFLTVLTAAVHSAAGGRVEVRVRSEGPELACSVKPLAPLPSGRPLSRDDYDGLEMARELIGMQGGAFEAQVPGDGRQPFAVRLALPAVGGVTVLVVDDNADTLALLERYTAGTRYSFVGLRDPEQALRLAVELSPRIIVLDVMLPRIDGWELLGRLLEHPRARHIPVMVCTILPAENLALSMGASGFLRKPVSRQAFLSALDSHLEPAQG